MTNPETYFVWDPELELGIPVLDEQHRYLVTLLNHAYYTAHKPETSTKAVATLLAELMNYAVLHFETEEYLMDEHRYTEREAHKREHKMFNEQLSNFVVAWITLDNTRALMDIAVFIKTWILEHVKHVDSKLRQLFPDFGSAVVCA